MSESIMCRHARDDFDALMIALGINNSGAKVICVTSSPSAAYPFIVFGEYDINVCTLEQIDDEITRLRETGGY